MGAYQQCINQAQNLKTKSDLKIHNEKHGRYRY